MRDFRKSLETLCENLYELYHDHEDSTHRIYYELYYEIICGYLVADRDLRAPIANMVKQIDIRLPWANGAENDVLKIVREKLLLVLEKDPLTKPMDRFSSTY